MPWEATALRDQPYPKVRCPSCNAYPLDPCMRGLVQRSKRRLTIVWWFALPIPWLAPQHYCAIICCRCHNVVGYESPIERED